MFGLADGGDDLERCPWFVYVTDLDSIAVDLSIGRGSCSLCARFLFLYIFLFLEM